MVRVVFLRVVRAVLGVRGGWVLRGMRGGCVILGGVCWWVWWFCMKEGGGVGECVGELALKNVEKSTLDRGFLCPADLLKTSENSYFRTC